MEISETYSIRNSSVCANLAAKIFPREEKGAHVAIHDGPIFPKFVHTLIAAKVH